MAVFFQTKSLAHAIQRFRSTGNLSLSNKGLTELPSTVCNFSEPVDPSAEAKWYEYADPTKFDVSHNELQALPAQLGDLVPLTVIDVSCNQLDQLPETMTQLVQLKLLDISRNAFTSLPQFLANLPALASLACADNKLVVFPDQIGLQQPSLAVVNASGNSIATLPTGLREAKALMKLELQGNKISEIPADYFSGMSSLAELNLSKNSISGELPDCFSTLVSLKILYVRENQITQIPDGIGSCTSLVELHAGFNLLTTIPATISALSQLRHLDLRGNRITELPTSMGALSLHLLDLSNNSLQTLPLELGLMTTLRSLPLLGNPMRQIRPSLVTGPLSALLKALRARLPDPNTPNVTHEDSRPSSRRQGTRSGNVFSVDEKELAAQAIQKLVLSNKQGELILRGTGLTELPEQVWEAAPTCVRLDLSMLPLTSWAPERLLTFTKLKTLRMTRMGLKEWPLPLKESALSLLEHLSLDRNPIAEVPEEPFMSCPNVRELNLAGILGMAALPLNSLACLTELVHLDLSQNRITTFPAELPNLTTLRSLKLRDNSLTKLPEELTQLTRLDELDVGNNNLSSVPPKIGLMGPTLRNIMLEGNMMKTIRRSILERGTPAILDYLRDRIPV